LKVFEFHPEALEEFKEALLHYQAHAPFEITVDFDAEIDLGLNEIARHPERFSRWRQTRARQYVVTRFPYVIFYIEYPEFIRILAVAHTSRRPGYWKKRIAVD
jgi:toxin ParE1/3/4